MRIDLDRIGTLPVALHGIDRGLEWGWLLVSPVTCNRCRRMRQLARVRERRDVMRRLERGGVEPTICRIKIYYGVYSVKNVGRCEMHFATQVEGRGMKTYEYGGTEFRDTSASG